MKSDTRHIYVRFHDNVNIHLKMLILQLLLIFATNIYTVTTNTFVNLLIYREKTENNFN